MVYIAAASNRTIAVAHRPDVDGSQVLQAELETEHHLKRCSDGVDIVVGTRGVLCDSRCALCCNGVVLRK